MTTDVYSELRKIWARINTDENVTDLDFDIRAHKKLLDIFQVGNYYYMINNVRQSRLELVSPEIEQVLGYPPGSFDLALYGECVHPADMPHFLNFEAAVERFFAALSGERLFRYKVQYDHRMRHANGHYIRILNQYIIIQHDADNVRTFVVQTDISHIKSDPMPVLSFIGIDGEPSYMNVDVQDIFRVNSPVLTGRERDVLRELVNGHNSLEISRILNISKHTVDSHRKNMLRKTNAGSTGEMIRMAYDKGWI